MRRTGFKRQPPPPKVPTLLRPLDRVPNYASASEANPAVQKDNPLRSEAYRRLVAALPCYLCGIRGYTQAAHADEGKGLGIKSDDRTCYPLCGPHDGKPGCHYLVGMTGAMNRDERRQLEVNAGAHTRRAILALGMWPKNLPLWETPTSPCVNGLETQGVPHE